MTIYLLWVKNDNMFKLVKNVNKKYLTYYVVLISLSKVYNFIAQEDN